MSYYRAALAAAYTGDMTLAFRLVNRSIELDERADSAQSLLALLNGQALANDTASIDTIRELAAKRKYKKALRVKLTPSVQNYQIRGFLFALTGQYGKAREEFALALTLDSGNILAKRALLHCRNDNKRNRM